MLKEIFFYELKYRLKRTSTWVYFGVFFILSFILVALSATELKGGSVNIAGSAKIIMNSGYSIFLVTSILSLFAVFIFPAIFGRSIYRDFEYNTHSIYFTLPISKFGYLIGRFLGSFVVIVIILLSIGLGIFLAQYFPTVQPERFSVSNFYNYFIPYLLIVIPNAIFIGIILYSMVLIFRDIMMVYVASTVMILAYFVASNYMGDIESHTIATLCDPFGLLTFDSLTRYWTISDKNTLTVPITFMMLINRLIYFGLGTLIFTYAYRRFQFSIFNVARKSRKEIVQKEEINAVETSQIFQTEYKVDYSSKANRNHLFRMIKHEFLGVINSFYFKVLLITGALMLFMEPVQVRGGDTELLPFTGYFIENVKASFLIFGLLILTFCTGELVWFERNKRLNSLYDALPIPTWIPYLSKLTALFLIQFIFMFVIMFVGIILQTMKGFYNYELGIYIQDLFGFTIFNYLLFAVLTMLVHILVNNKFTGHFVMMLFYIITLFYSKLGINNYLFRFNESASMPFSEMNEFGHFVFPFYAYKLYWIFFSGILVIVGLLFWVRGNETSFKYRVKLAKMRFTKPVRNFTIIFALLFLASGAYIFYNTNVLNKFQTSKEYEQFKYDYELKYKYLENSNQLTVIDVFMNVDIFPQERDFKVKGTYWLKNQTDIPIDSVVIYFNRKFTINNVTFNKNFNTLLNDNEFGYHIYQLSEPAAPNDSVKLDFDYEYITNGFVNSGSNTDIIYNGTFLSSTKYVPTIGYNSDLEIGDDDVRKTYGLADIQRAKSVFDTTQYSTPFGGAQFRLINFEAIVSTSADQIAVAPGHLVKEWTENNRRYFHYKPERKIANYYSFLSADYEVKRDTFNGVNLEIYYIPKHTYNIERMMASMKNSLKYFSANFNPFQYHDLRIVEFPYGDFAESFSTTIPFSENLGFTEKYDVEKNGVDYLNFVTSHEIAHQWWAHQVEAANVQGTTFVIETLTQYSAMMVLKNEYTEKQMNKFIRYSLDKYLRGRTKEKQKEMPLYMVENQGYLHYEKGAVVMWALYDYIGEDSINVALRKIIKKFAYNETIYPTSIDVINCFKEVTPDSLQYIYEDMFETITLYENVAKEATFTKTADGKYLVQLTVESQKFRADSLGTETEIPINDWIEIGITDSEDEIIYKQKYKITQHDNTFEIVVDKEPARAGIDMFYKLIDRQIENNSVEVALME